MPRPRPTSSFRVLLLVLLVLLGSGASSPRADAAVSLRAASCNSFSIAFWPPYSMDIAKPAGTVAGDLMVATVRTSGWYSSSAGPSGWTEYLNDGESSVTWYRIATASEPSSYTFQGPSGGGAMVGGIVAFSGVDPAAPFASAQQSTTGTTAAVSLPGGIATRAGSMRYSTITSGAARTSTFGAGLTEACDRTVGSIAMGSAYEATGVGAVAARTVTRSGTGSHVSQTFVINPASTCGGGSLGLSPPATVPFGATTLTGYDQTVVTSTSLRVNDLSGLGLGWNLSATSTPFVSGVHSLPIDAARVASVTPVAAPGNCSLPVNTMPGGQILPAGLVPPTATKLFNAAPGSGEGPVDLDLGLQLRIPGGTRVGTYTSVWTFTLGIGP